MDQNQNSTNQGVIKDQINQNFDIRRFIASIFSYWYIIVLCIGIALSAAFLYLRYTTPLYQVKSSLLLDAGEGGGSQSNANVLKKIGIQDEGINMFNEIMLLKSQDLIKEVVDSLDLNMRYWIQGKVKENEIYEESPIKIVFDSVGYLGGMDEIFVEGAKEGDKNIDGLFEMTYGEKTERVPFDTWKAMPFGKMKIVYANGYRANKGYLDGQIKVTLLSDANAVAQFLNVLQIFPTDGRTSMLEVSMIDNLPLRAIDFINVLVVKYHVNELSNAVVSATKTRDFIDKRQQDLAEQLKGVDSKVVGIKVSNNMIDVGTQGGAY
ncbi:MAG: hypothetical protein IT256_02575, partial [Chitinophagaceae bacterium]|nr:hypothetical protein [Chitinophagaceae bacterium]